MSNFKKRMESYRRHPGSFLLFLLVMLSALATFVVLLFLIAYILIKGVPNLKPSLFSWTYTTENASMVLSLLIAVPLGIFSAIYLTEYAKKGNKLVAVVRLTTETLSGIPSIVYGLFGSLFFVTYLKWSYSLAAGALTLAIMILPLVMRTTEEALKSVPDMYREGSFGLGAGKLRTVFCVVLPSAIPGILSGVILSIGRIVGETAALIYTAGSIPQIPSSIMGSGATLAVHMYNLSKEGLYTDQAYAVAVVLLLLVLLINWVSSRIGSVLCHSNSAE